MQNSTQTNNEPKHRPISDVFLELIALFVCTYSVLVEIDLAACLITQAERSPYLNFAFNITNVVGSMLLSIYTGFFYLEGQSSPQRTDSTGSSVKRMKRILISYGTVILLLGIATVCQTIKHTPVTIEGMGKMPVTALHILYILAFLRGARKMVAFLKDTNLRSV